MKRILITLIVIVMFVIRLTPVYAATRADGVLGFLTEDTSIGIGTAHGQIQKWNNKPHIGYDLSVTEGMPLYAPYSGTVEYVQKYTRLSDGKNHTASYGNMAILVSDEAGSGSNSSKYILKFCHFKSFIAEYDQFKLAGIVEDGALGRGADNYDISTHKVGTPFHVEAGDLIGYAGSTGNSSGVHCHVELILNGRITDHESFNVSGTVVDPNAYITDRFSAKSLANKHSGCLDMAYTYNGMVRLMGWALKEKDPNAAVQIEAVIKINGYTTRKTFWTDQYRGDIAGGVGNHGFDISIPVGNVGSGTVILYMKQDDGKTTQIGDHAYSIRVDPVSSSIKIESKSLNYKPGDIFDRTYRGYSGQLGFAYWTEATYWGVTSLKQNTYLVSDNIDQLGIQFWMQAGSHLRLKDGKSLIGIYTNDVFAQFLMLSDQHTLELCSVSWELLPIFLNNMHGGVEKAEIWNHVGTTMLEGEASASSPVQNAVQVSGWISSESSNSVITIVINIGGVNHTMYVDTSSGNHNFNWFLSTQKTGRNLVIITAKNTDGGNDLELFRGYVDIAGDMINHDCMIVIEKPQGTYDYNASPDISGWIASNVPVTSCSASGITGLGTMDLTSSLRDASYELDAIGYGGYRYKQRFSGTIRRDLIINGTNYNMQVDVNFDNGTHASSSKTSFYLKILEIRDGTGMDTWFSENPGGAPQTSFTPGETVYLCYRLTSTSYGCGVDAAHPEYAYTVQITVSFPDGTNKTLYFSTDENWIGIPTQMAGHYEITLSGSGDIHVNPQSLSLDVPVKIKPKTKLWTGYTPNETIAIGERCVGGTYYGSYNLIDKKTNLLVNQSAEYYSYTVKMELIDPDGNVADSKTFLNADSGHMAYTLRKAGNHLLKLTLTGTIGGLDASEYDYSSMFTAYQEDTKIIINSTAGRVEPGDFKNYLVYKTGYCGSNWDYRISVDNDCVTCQWTSEAEHVNCVKGLKITGIREGHAKAALELYDTSSGAIYDTQEFHIYCEVPSYQIIYNANGGEFAPSSGEKRKNENYIISRAYYSHGGDDWADYKFLGWSTDPNAQMAEYIPGSVYTENAPLTLYAVWEHGARYNYDANGGSNAPSTEWHSDFIESSPFSLSSIVPVRLGYIFKGWSRSSSSTSASYQPGSKCYLSGGQTFYAVWELDSSILAYGSCGTDAQWTINDGNVLSIQGSGTMADYSLSGNPPWASYSYHSVVVGNGITSIGNYAFYRADSLKNVSLPLGLTYIGNCAFRNCDNLRTINIPDSVTSLGTSVFAECDELTSVHLSKKLTKLPDYTFHLCNGLISLSIPGNIKETGKYSIAECKNLTYLSVESGVQKLGNYICSSDRALKSISLPDTLLSIGDGAFSSCSALTELSLPSGITELPYGALYGCSSIKNLTVPEGVKTIGRMAIGGCISLYGVSLPSTLNSVGEEAFAGDTALRYIQVYAAGTSFDSTSFNGLSGIIIYGVSGGSSRAFFENAGFEFREMVYGNSAVQVNSSGVLVKYSGMGGIVDLSANTNIKVVGESAFENSPIIEKVILPSTVTDIETKAFYGCKNLESVTLPSSIKTIKDSAFYGCSKLTNIAMPKSLAIIGPYAFYNCNLDSITLPSSVTSIGERAFAGCPFESVSVPDGVTKLSSGVFQNCSKLKRATLPGNLSEIGNAAFYGCTLLTGISIPDTVVSIGSSAFFNCTSLTEITIPEKVTCIEQSAFYNCKALCRISLPGKLTSIKSSAFVNCSGLSSISLPDALTEIGSNAFYGSGLVYISVPEGVTTINSSTFGKCENLVRVIFSTGVKTINSTAFSYCASLKAVTIPRTVISVAPSLFSACTKLEFLYTAEGCAADLWFSANRPEVTIIYLWGIPAVSGVSLNRSTYTISWLAETTLTATVYPDEAKTKDVIWSSSDPEWVSVDQNGRIKAHRSGRTVKITATTVDGGYTASCDVTIRAGVLTVYFDGNGGTPPVELARATLSDDLIWGEIPEAVRDGWLFDGWYLGREDDSVRITQDMPVGWFETNSITIYAHWKTYPDLEDITLYLGQGEYASSRKMTPVFLEFAAKEGAVISSSAPDIAKVLDGKVIGLKAGDATLTVTLESGGKIKCTVHVIKLSAELILPKGLKTLEAEAFMDNTSIDAVYIPSGIKTIPEKAFYGCSNLKLLVVPPSVTTIASNAFINGLPDLVVCSEGSYAKEHFENLGVEILIAP